MSWKKISITIFLLIVFLNILQINIFLYFYFSQSANGETGNGLSSETITTVWYGEFILGVALLAVAIYYFLTAKKQKKELPAEETVKTPTGEVKISATTGYNHVNPFYKINIQNATSMPIIDVIISPRLSKEAFTLDMNERRIPLIRANESKIIKFVLLPKRDENGEANMLCHVRYYNLGIDDYEECMLEPEKITVIWPELKESEIELEEWEKVKDTLLKAEENITDIPLSGEECVRLTTEIIKKNNLYTVTSHTLEDPYEATAAAYTSDENELRYGVELFVTAKGKSQAPSELDIAVYAEDNETLTGFYYTLFDEIQKIVGKEEKEITVEEGVEKEIAEAKPTPTPEISKMAAEGMEPHRDLYEEFDVLRHRVETIEKDKIGVDSKYTSLYELDELYKILAEDLVKRRIVDIKAGEEIVKKRLDKKYLEELKRFDEAYALLCEAETSDSVLTRKDFPNSGKKAILLVYFNAAEVYIRERLKELIPKGVTVLLGENHGHINTRKKDWEKSWAVLSLGSCIHIINRNKYLFLKNEELWKRRVETLMHQVRELRNTVAHPSKENPDPRLVREKVYKLLMQLPEVLKSKDVSEADHF
ncbi:MAG: hypothetical protein JSV56_06175 [Methanomassiliicoccales archaeon]|nr:MAG: hypothetical protein JSV56_06175 [Methanomassiliicoccales archaeon]